MSRTFMTVIALAILSCAVVWAQTRPAPAPEGRTSESKRSGWKTLSSEEARVVEACGTEAPFSGKWLKHENKGTYTCTRCGAPLFSSDTKFDSRSGWPAFDEEIPGAVRQLPDPDGVRIEIECASCGGHLGHVFKGENHTPANARHCVNSLSMKFVKESE